MPKAVSLNLIYGFFRVVHALMALAIVFKDVVYRLKLGFCIFVSSIFASGCCR